MVAMIESFLFSSIRTMTPILFAALAALISRKSGIMNVGIEGIMMISALFSVIFSYMFDNILLGLLSMVFLAILIGLSIGLLIMKLQINPVVMGTAINLLGGGGTIFFLYIFLGDRGYSTNVGKIPDITLPIIQNIPAIGRILSGHNLLTYLALLLAVFLFVFFYKCIWGLRFRATGENAEAVMSAGINVARVRYISLALSSIVAALGGAYMSMSYMNGFNINMVAGRGFIGLAVEEMSFGNPLLSIPISFFFGIFSTLSNYLQGIGISVQLIQATPYACVIICLIIMMTIQKRKKYGIAK